MADALGHNQPGLARAYALARWGGFRRGTICRIPLNAPAFRPDLTAVPQRHLLWISEKLKILRDKREDARLSELLDAPQPGPDNRLQCRPIRMEAKATRPSSRASQRAACKS